jgi:hypothetical protein
VTTPSAGAQAGLVEPPLQHGERGGRRLDLRVRDGAAPPSVRLGRRHDWPALGDVGARGRHVVLGLVEALLRGGVAARQATQVCCNSACQP